MKLGAIFPECGFPTSGDLGQDPNPELDAYLDRLDDPLRGVVSPQERSSFLEQTRGHLEQAIAEHMEQGHSKLLATQSVLEKYGDPAQNAEEYLESWFQYRMRTPLSRRFGRGNLVAYGVFQAAAVVYYLILQVDVFLPAEAMYRIPWRLTPLQVREVWPEPLPFPDLSVRFFLTIGWPVIAPIVSGVIVGLMVPARAYAAVYRGLMPLILLSFVMGALLLPMTQGILFALFQVVFWLPMGCLSAWSASRLSRLRRTSSLNSPKGCL
jgi:hypothetical protein